MHFPGFQEMIHHIPKFIYIAFPFFILTFSGETPLIISCHKFQNQIPSFINYPIFVLVLPARLHQYEVILKFETL